MLSFLSSELGDNNIILKDFLARASKAQVEKLLKNYASLIISFNQDSQTKYTTVCCYDLDSF